MPRLHWREAMGSAPGRSWGWAGPPPGSVLPQGSQQKVYPHCSPRVTQLGRKPPSPTPVPATSLRFLELCGSGRGQVRTCRARLAASASGEQRGPPPAGPGLPGRAEGARGCRAGPRARGAAGGCRGGEAFADAVKVLHCSACVFHAACQGARWDLGKALI